MSKQQTEGVLATVAPGVSPADAAQIGRSLFGLNSSNARDLESERDRTLMLEDDDGQPVAVLKVSNAAENPAILDMEAGVALHANAVDPSLGVAVPRPAAGPARDSDSGLVGGDPDLAGLRAQWRDGEVVHWCRAYDVLPGKSQIDPTRLSDAALGSWGESAARLGVALRSYTNPLALRPMLWDVQYALSVRPMLSGIADPAERELVSRTLDEFERTVLPAWPRLRSQIVHTDITVDNTLSDSDGRITGIIDFGDMSQSAMVVDLASMLDSLGAGRSGAELYRMARLVIDGHERVVELEDLERDLLGVLWATRSAVTVAIGSWRYSEGLADESFTERFNAPCLGILRTLLDTGWPEVARQLGSNSVEWRSRRLAERRETTFGPTMEPLFYTDPVQVASADGVWITDTDGNRYLDAYNNVPCIGHGHPRVRTAVAAQNRQTNTHMRYLHPAAIELAERLIASCPPELDTVMLVNSGSEANDMAWRMATGITGARGGLCTAFGYHGITEMINALSPQMLGDYPAPEHVETWEPPDSYRGEHLDTSGFEAALARMNQKGLRPAVAILDGLVMSDRISDLDPGYIQELVRLTHEAGGLWIADEVQAGHCRSGDRMWTFERFGVVPDFVTLGKPMGNGHPVAAVITRRELVQALPPKSFFSTFGGNPASAAAGLAVLDVLEDERVLDRVHAAGDALRTALGELASRHEAIGDVRVIGLACGVELVADRGAKTPDAALTKAVKDGLRNHGVLVGTTGRDDNILKVRPPLAFTADHVPLFVKTLDDVLAEVV